MHKITTKTTKIRYTFLQSIVSEMIYEPFSVVTCACNENIHSIVYRAGHPHSRFVLYLSQHKRIAVHLRISWTPHKPSTVKNEQKIKIFSKHTRIGVCVYVSPCFFFFFFVPSWKYVLSILFTFRFLFSSKLTVISYYCHAIISKGKSSIWLFSYVFLSSLKRFYFPCSWHIIWLKNFLKYTVFSKDIFTAIWKLFKMFPISDATLCQFIIYSKRTEGDLIRRFLIGNVPNKFHAYRSCEKLGKIIEVYN